MSYSPSSSSYHVLSPQPDQEVIVPQVRPVADYHATNERAASTMQQTSARYSEIGKGGATMAYLRHHDSFAQQTMEEVLVDYDMDEVDEAWLSKFKGKKGGVSLAGGGGAGGGEGAGPSTSAASTLETTFEEMMGRLERMAQEAVVQSDEKNGWLAKGVTHPVTHPLHP